MSLNRSQNSSVSTFYNKLQHFLHTDQVINIFLCQIVGDFNINVLNSTTDNLHHVFIHMLIVSELISVAH